MLKETFTADYDLVFSSLETMSVFRTALRSRGAKPMSVTLGPINPDVIGEDLLYRGKVVQLKYAQTYDKPEDQMDTADFTICQFAVDLAPMVNGQMWYLAATYSAQGLVDAEDHVLRIHKLTQPTATLGRIYKFMARGYKPESNVDFWLPLVKDIRQMPWTPEAFEPIRKAKLEPKL